MDKNTIINGNCLDVLRDKNHFPDESIDLIVTSPPYADKRGKNYPTIPGREYVEWLLKISEELKRVLIHGVLHLCGYKDKGEEERAIMRKKENYYLSNELLPPPQQQAHHF